MKKIININLSSRLIPIEDSAYELLRQYLDSLKRYFSQEEGADEIVSDIESRIAEIFQDKIKKGAHCITDVDVNEIKAAMGTPEQFGDEQPAGNNANNSQSQQQQQQYAFDPSYVRPRKRFYRDGDNKVIGGVCSGLAAYFRIDPVILRILFVITALFWGGGILVYLILWFATPEADSAAEKLEMRGERVDVNNIKATVQEEMNQIRARMEGMGEDVRNFSAGRGKQFGRDAGSAIESFFRGLGNAIVWIAKGFFLFFGFVLLFVMVVGLIAAASFSAVLVPIKDLIFAEGTQSMLFWPALALLIGVPILSLILFLVRKITGNRMPNKYAGMTLGFFWILGIVLAIALAVSVSRDFSTENGVREQLTIQQPSTGRLIISTADEMLDIDDHPMFDDHVRISEDTIVIGHIVINMEKSLDDKFSIMMGKKSRGRSSAEARDLARQIQFQISQRDSVIFLPSGFSIPRDSKYRLQRVYLTIYVPAGKEVIVDREARNHFHFDGYRRGRWWDEGHNWDEHDRMELKMNDNGDWERRDLPPAPGSERHQRDSLDRNYRYRGPDRENPAPAKTDTVPAAAEPKATASRPFVGFLFNTPVAYS
ncbi:PspC domain-containing protein [Chitinophaga pollutisoli]|uniref:PspC domain-containing protein n=1 Tax=Chitinophaga pollutisoli TaxID=3133966 RepID=A0ABZ2YJ91_9BACT